MMPKPNELPALKQRLATCGHQTYYLNPHDMCTDCKPVTCDYCYKSCDQCSYMKIWARLLCRKKLCSKQNRMC